MNTKTILFCIFLFTSILFVIAIAKAEYDPKIKPSDFSGKGINQYFKLTPGTKFTFENKSEKGIEKIEIAVTPEVKTVIGIKTIVVRDKVTLDGVLVEDTRDWFATDNEGNVWYFGEEVDNFENGLLKDHKGSWEAGVNGALPGIMMPSKPKIGSSHRQEFAKGIAEDMGTIVSLNNNVTVPGGTFENCLQTRDWSLIDKKLNEFKLYCPKPGFLVLEKPVSGEDDRVELTEISSFPHLP